LGKPSLYEVWRKISEKSLNNAEITSNKALNIRGMNIKNKSFALKQALIMP